MIEINWLDRNWFAYEKGDHCIGISTEWIARMCAAIPEALRGRGMYRFVAVLAGKRFATALARKQFADIYIGESFHMVNRQAIWKNRIRTNAQRWDALRKGFYERTGKKLDLYANFVWLPELDKPTLRRVQNDEIFNYQPLLNRTAKKRRRK